MCSWRIVVTEWEAKARRTIEKSLWTTLPIILLAISVPIIALLVPSLVPEDELLATWFQRCGSIVVALAVWIEIKNNIISGYLYPSGLSTSDFEVLKKDYRLYFNLVKWSGFVLAILGTIIWGYGDIPLKNK